MIVHLVDGTYELFRHFYGLRRFTGPGPSLWRRARCAADDRADARERCDASGCRHRSRHRIVSQRPLARLQNRRRDRRGVVGAVSTAGRCAGRDGRRGLADGRIGGGRRTGIGRAHLGAFATRGQSLHLDRRQGSRAMRAGRSRRANGSPCREDARRRSGAREIRCRARADPRLPCSRRRCGRRLPGHPGIGVVSAARLLNQYGPIEAFPQNVLGDQRERALLFKQLATLKSDAKLFRSVDTLCWRGPTPAFAKWAERLAAPRLLERCLKVQASMSE